MIGLFDAFTSFYKISFTNLTYKTTELFNEDYDEFYKAFLDYMLIVYNLRFKSFFFFYELGTFFARLLNQPIMNVFWYGLFSHLCIFKKDDSPIHCMFIRIKNDMFDFYGVRVFNLDLQAFPHFWTPESSYERNFFNQEPGSYLADETYPLTEQNGVLGLPILVLPDICRALLIVFFRDFLDYYKLTAKTENPKITKYLETLIQFLND